MTLRLLLEERNKILLLLNAIALAVLTQGLISPQPMLETGTLLIILLLASASLLLGRWQSHRRWLWLIPLTLTLGMGVWLRDFRYLGIAIPLYTQAAPLFLLTLGREEEQQSGPEPFTKLEIALLGLIVALGFFLLAYNLENIPPGLHGDEGESGMQALALLHGKVPGLFLVGWYHQPMLAFAWHAISMAIFGETVFGLRMSSVLAGTLSLILTYLLTRLLFNKKVALLATTMMAFAHSYIGLNRLGINYTQTTVLELACFYFFFRGLRSQGLLNYALSGLAMGLGFYMYFASRLVPFVLAPFIIYESIAKKGFIRQNLNGILAVFLVAALVFAPMAFYFKDHPEQFMSRTNSVYFFNNLKDPERSYGTTDPIHAFLIQAGRMLIVFNHGPDMSGQYGYKGPLLEYLTAIFFVFGLAYSSWRLRDSRHMFLLLWFWLTLVIGGMLTLPAPFSPRLAGMMPVLFIFAALALERTLAMVAQVIPRPAILGLVLLTLGAMAFNNYQIYFVNYVNSVQGWAMRESATSVAKYIASRKDTYQFYLLGPPKLYIHHGTISFIARDFVGEDVSEPKDYIPLRAYVLKDNVAFILLPHTIENTSLLESYYPSGHLTLFEKPSGELWYAVFEVSKEDVQAVQNTLAGSH